MKVIIINVRVEGSGQGTVKAEQSIMADTEFILDDEVDTKINELLELCKKKVGASE